MTALVLLPSVVVVALAALPRWPGPLAPQETTPKAAQIERFSIQRRELREASGIARSLANPGWYWLHNDSGAGPYLLAMDAERRIRFRLRVTRGRSLDWEDIAVARDRAGQPWIYVGDVGRNLAGKKADPPCVYALPEPKIGRDFEAPRPTAPNQRLQTFRSRPAVEWKLAYAERRAPNIEAMFALGSERLAFVTKERSGKSDLHALELPQRFVDATLRVGRIGRLRLDDAKGARSRLATAADVDEHGRLVVLTYERVVLFELPAAMGRTGSPLRPEKGKRGDKPPRLRPIASIALPRLQYAEALATTGDGNALIVSEGRPAAGLRVRLPPPAKGRRDAERGKKTGKEADSKGSAKDATKGRDQGAGRAAGPDK